MLLTRGTMDPADQSFRATLMAELFRKKKKLTPDDLQLLRDNYEGWGMLSSRSDPFMFRMQVELIDALGSLETAIARLLKR